jgi:hypothetical protein
MSRRALALSVALSLVLCAAAASSGTGLSDEHACCRERAPSGAVLPGGAEATGPASCCEAPAIPTGAERGLDAPAPVALPVASAACLAAAATSGIVPLAGRARALSPPDRTTVLRL